MSIFIKECTVFVLMLGLSIVEGHITCDTCRSTKSWTECNQAAEPVECRHIMLRGMLYHWGYKNPNLTVAADLADPDRYKCVQLKIIEENKSPLYMKQCTLEQTDWCSGWIDGVTVEDCSDGSYWLEIVLVVFFLLVFIAFVILYCFYIRYKHVFEGGFFA
ncbi:uncharacterized protein LOC129748979 [Uranotaenia lowii]|uniref:uncharacterized protein LOC129748979 n=1 Tax=Uranotaenia lowii TaxID=190385 RepID=UPI0024799E37|nr:uncharacterized protein LOC129748979 [Uranotaenia lowii]